MSDVNPLILPVIDTKVAPVSWTQAQATGGQPEPLEQRLRRAQGPAVQPHVPPSQASQHDEEPTSRLPPPPNVASLLPGGRSNPPPAMEAINIEFEESVRAFSEAALELALARPVLISTLESQLLDLAIEIAQAIVEREVDRDPQLHWTLARAALQSIGDGGSATLRTSPDAFDAIIGYLGSDRAEVNGVQVHLVADHTIPGLGCIVDADQARIDATLAERLRGARRAFEEERRRSGESSE